MRCEHVRHRAHRSAGPARRAASRWRPATPPPDDPKRSHHYLRRNGTTLEECHEWYDLGPKEIAFSVSVWGDDFGPGRCPEAGRMPGGCQILSRIYRYVEQPPPMPPWNRKYCLENLGGRWAE